MVVCGCIVCWMLVFVKGVGCVYVVLVIMCLLFIGVIVMLECFDVGLCMFEMMVYNKVVYLFG